MGLIIGFIFGATNIIRYGPGPNGMMRTLGQYMLGSAATFGYVTLLFEPVVKWADELQLLHVDWYHDPHRKLADNDRSLS